MKTSRYLLLKTLWVALLPVFPLYVIMPFLGTYDILNEPYASVGVLIVAPIACFIWAIIPFLLWRLLRWIRKTFQYEDMPENFVPCLLPWFIPLYHTLLATFATYLAACLGWENANLLFTYGQPAYFFVGNYLMEFPQLNIISISPIVLSSVMAIVGIYKVLDDRPPVKHWQWYFITPVLVLGIGIIVAHVRLCYFT